VWPAWMLRGFHGDVYLLRGDAVSVYEVTLNDCLHPVAPPETVLRISCVEQTAFVSIATYTENAKSRTIKEIAEIAVSLPALRQALQLLSDDGFREGMRPPIADNTHGEKEAYLRMGPVRGTVPL
jgi:hypothetical protein